MIANKLDLLMKITDTGNTTLGNVVFFDSSYLGRIRAGKRGLPKSQPFIRPIAEYFANNLNDDFQRKIIGELVCDDGMLPSDKNEVQQLIENWLMKDSDATEYDPVEFLMCDVAAFSTKQAGYPVVVRPFCPTKDKATFFYGNEGKRNGVIEFLRDLCSAPDPTELMIYSDEDFAWSNEDPLFMKKWNSMLAQFISTGGKITVIHTVTKGITELTEAIHHWMPLYMTGKVNPFYYPKPRDGLYHRTLMVAKNGSAFVSSSIKDHTEESLNIWVCEKCATETLEKEFEHYMELCTPLLKVFRKDKREGYEQEMQAYSLSPENFSTVSCTPSMITMPEHTADLVTRRAGDRGAQFLKIYNAVRQCALDALECGKRITEVLYLPTAKRVAAGKVAVAMSDMFGEAAYYTKEEFISHLNNILEMTEKYPGYNVVITRKAIDGVMLNVKENVGAILATAYPPSAIFCICEPSLVSLCEDYANRYIGRNIDKAKNVEKLKKYLAKLR